MTTAVNDTLERYTISGTGPYAFSFRIFNDSDLTVVALSSATPPAVTPFTLGSHYTVSGVNAAAGGTVTLQSGTATTYAGYTLDIRSNTPADQPTSLRNLPRFLPEVSEDAYDYLSRQIQDINRRLNLAVRFPDNMSARGEMTPVQNWTEKYLTVSAAGTLEPALLSDTTMTQSTIGALLYPVLAAEGSTVVNGWLPYGNLKRYGAVGDNSANDTTAINNAITSATAMRCPVFVPVGEFRTTGIVLSSGSFLPPFVGEDGGAPNTRRISALIYAGAAGGKLITITGLGSAVKPVFRHLTLHGGGNADWGIYCTNQRGGWIDDCHFEEYARVSDSTCVELRNTNGGGDNTEQWSITNSNFLNYRTGIRMSNETSATYPSHAYGYYDGNTFAAQNVNSQDLDIGGPNSGGSDGGAAMVRCYWQARTHVSGTGGRHIRVRSGSSLYQSQLYGSGESDNGGANTPYYRIEANGAHGDIAFVGSLDIVEAGLPAGNVMDDNINNASQFYPCELFSSGWSGAAGRTNKFSGGLSLINGGLKVAEGSNAKQGVATLVGGTVTVSNTSVTASSRIFVTSNADGGTPGWLRISARVNGTSFTITSSSGTDTSTVAWEIFEPA